MSKYGHRTINWFEVIVDKMGGERMAEQFLRGELVLSEPPSKWQEHDGVIRFAVTSDGTTGPAWAKRLKQAGIKLSEDAECILNSPEFRTTNGVMTEIVVLKAAIFKDSFKEGRHELTVRKIMAEARRRGLIQPRPEIACLIREKFSDEELKKMGLASVVVMHDPIADPDGYPSYLNVDRDLDGQQPYLSTDFEEDPNDPPWLKSEGFAFLVS